MSLNESSQQQGYPHNPDFQRNITSFSEGFIDPIQELAKLWAYKWQIILFVILFALLGVYAALSTTPIYRATTTLFLQSNNANVINIDDVYDSRERTDIERNTQFEILKSSDIAQRVANQINVEKYSELSLDNEKNNNSKGFLGRLKQLISVLKNDEIIDKAAARDGSSNIKLIKLLKKKIKIEPVLNSQLVKVHADTEDPVLSSQLSDMWVRAYITSEIDSRLGVNTQATDWLNQRLEKVRNDLEASEAKLQKFYESQQLVNMGGARNILAEEFSDNARRLRESRKKQTDLQNVYKKIIESGNNLELMQEIPRIQTDPLVQSTKRSYLAASEAVRELEPRYGKKHPRMIAAKAKLDEARDAYFRQLRLATDGIKSDYEIAKDTVNSLSGIVEKSKNQLGKLDRKEYELQLLKREVDTNRELFNTLLTRFKETDISSNLDISNTRIVDKAVQPSRPFRPRKKLWVISFILFGFLLGTSIALLRSFLDNRIRLPSELEGLTGLAVLGALPLVKEYANSANKLSRMEIEQPNSIFSEGIRTIRTGILLSDSIEKKRTVMVTSSVPSEGKTSVAVNLALAFAQMEKVLLIDCDFRKPSVASYLNLKKGICGVNEALSGEAPLKDCISKLANEKLHVLPCPKSPPNPAELIASKNFRKMLISLGEHYERIIIDSPPCQAVSDALILGNIADATIFLTKADSTPKSHVLMSVRKLQESKVNVIGAILNQAVANNKYDYEFSYYQYSDYYSKS